MTFLFCAYSEVTFFMVCWIAWKLRFFMCCAERLGYFYCIDLATPWLSFVLMPLVCPGPSVMWISSLLRLLYAFCELHDLLL